MLHRKCPFSAKESTKTGIERKIYEAFKKKVKWQTNPTLLMITLNVNELNNAIKKMV